MRMDFATYRDKVMGCWAGKNAGGVLGAPFEGRRQLNDVEFYIQDLSAGPPPNDDLDLQLVWLAAVENHGPAVDASVLGQYWLSYIIPDWVEYGTGKANLRRGLPPPASGAFGNVYRDSCGCFIRSEIWACLNPGHPGRAARYAYEDAVVDHGTEGAAAEVFCAALQSAAFVEGDPRRLIDIALSFVPADGLLARAVRAVVDARDAGADWKEARRRLRRAAPGTFGVQNWELDDGRGDDGENLPFGAPGMDAPENVGYVILGWLYGEGDFGRSICLATNCGEDTDCSAATLGALLGILQGYDALPRRWLDPLGDKIAVMCVNTTNGMITLPKTIGELTDRVLRQTPAFLGAAHCDILAPGGYTLELRDPGRLVPPEIERPAGLSIGMGREAFTVREKLEGAPYRAYRRFGPMEVCVDPGDDLYFTAEEKRPLKVVVRHAYQFNQQFWCTVRVHASQDANGMGVRCAGGNARTAILQPLAGMRAEFAFDLDMADAVGADVDLLVEVAFHGHPALGAVRVKLLRR